MKKVLFSVLFLCFALFSNAESLDIEPTITPSFFAADEEITISYDVTGTTMHDWTEAWLWLWIPNLNDLNVPSNVNPATSNATATNPAKFTKSTQDGKQIFSITLTLTDFVNRPKEDILSVGMLIKGNDWSDGQSKDYITDITTGFALKLLSPTGNFGFYNASENITISAITSQLATIEIFLDGSLLTSSSNVDALETMHTIIGDGNVHNIKVKASAGAESEEISYAYALSPTTPVVTLPSGLRDGINYHADNTSATLVLLAPNKSNVFVIGDFNNWSIDDNYLMNRDGDKYWLKITNLTEAQEYRFQYLVDGDLRIADPYTEKIGSQFDDGEIISDGRYPGLQPYPKTLTSEAVSYLQTAKPQFNWQAASYQRPSNDELVIYEALVRDFTEERTYNAMLEKLDYLQDLGINALELMPVMEFEGNLSWGYNPAFMLATDKYYGTEKELKILIDEAHKRGMAVIFDIVLNHTFGRSSLARLYNDDVYGPPTVENIWLNRNAKHDFNVGYDFNHESQHTKDYTDRVVEYWLQEYNIDGYRFDLSKGFTQKNTIGNVDAWGKYDASRIALLKRMADVIWATDPTAYVILEHFAENSEETELADYGMMLWGNMNHTYRRVAKGNQISMGWLHHEARGWQNPHVVGYMESHDEERVMWDLMKSGNRTLKESLNRVKMNAAFFFLVPGPKMIWQFEELGYDVELNDDRVGVKPSKWEYLEDTERKKLHDVYTSLINLKTQTRIIDDGDFEWNTSSDAKWITIKHADVDIAVVGNFDESFANVEAHFTANGTWYNYLTGASVEVTDFNNHTIPLNGSEFHIYTSKEIENYIDSIPVSTVLGVEDMTGENIKIFPNPSEDNLVIEATQNIEYLVISDINGRTIKTIDNIQQRKNAKIDISVLKQGLYILEIQQGNKKVYKRFIKK